MKLLSKACGIVMQCPAVYDAGEKYLIVGDAWNEALPKVGKGEQAVTIVKGLFDSATERANAAMLEEIKRLNARVGELEDVLKHAALKGEPNG